MRKATQYRETGVSEGSASETSTVQRSYSPAKHRMAPV